MKRLLPLLLLGATASAQATNTLHQIYIQPSLANLKIDGSHGSALMTQVGYNYHFAPMLAMDLSYYMTASINDIVHNNDKASATGTTIAAKLYFPMSYYGSFYGKFGLNRTNVDYQYNVNNQTLKQEAVSTKPYLSVGTIMRLFPSTTFNIEYQYIPLASDDYISSIGAGVNFMF
ncbi:outer membrane beta-barrel protein [Aliivibrio sp. S3MY1]|uniref:outer membrane beta-barrel protein n=1 Tax=unclassified Aliivibrio TaxID=2645654 RepID=UPI002379D2E1|nr:MULTISPECIES: outer membrane beta-barrel protein [unclassified Aliivibrio]MDD9195128.1 outer membrane beta-barrel protein [Aliivibrio sp. S3MY1]MDD9198418.1 outer membrane beta-barrel protein [Aliivibrio sp. S2MY1]